MKPIYTDEEWATLQEIADASGAGFVPGLDDEEARCRALDESGSAGLRDGRYYLSFMGQVDLANRPVTK